MTGPAPGQASASTSNLPSSATTVEDNISVLPAEQSEFAREKGHPSVEKYDAGVDTQPVGQDDEDVPDGGLQGWLTVLGVWFMQFSTFGYTNAHGVYTDFYIREYLSNYTSSQISWIGSVQFMITLSSGLITGRLFDAGYFYHLIIASALVFTFCLFMLSLAQPQQFYQIILSQGIGLGTGIGLSYIPTLSAIATHFQHPRSHRRRALALGLATSGSAIGGLVHPILLNKLIFGHGGSGGGGGGGGGGDGDGKMGFGRAVRVSAGVNAAGMVIALVCMRARYPGGGLGRGVRRAARSRSRAEKGSTITSADGDDVPPQQPGLWKNVKTFYRDGEYCFTSAAMILVFLGLYFPIFFLQLDAIQKGVDANLAFYSLTIMNGANALGRIVPNIAVPVVGAFNVMIPTALGASVLIFALDGVKSAAGVVAFAAIFGFFSGSYIGLLAPLLGTLARNTSEIGARVGICMSFSGFAVLIGSPISGALLGTNFTWIRPIIFGGVSVALGCVCFVVARFLLVRRRGTWRV